MLTQPAAASLLSLPALAFALDQSVDCVKLLGLGGDILYMNSNGQCAMEIDDVCAIIGTRWRDLYPEEARAEIGAAIATARDGGVARFRAFCPTQKGNPRWWDMTVSAVTDVGGVHSGYLAISRDVTESEVAREALAIAAAEMRHRLGNSYQMLVSLMNGFARGDAAREVFAREIGARLIALGQAQALFAGDDEACAVGPLIEALVTAFDTPSCPVVVAPMAVLMVDRARADAIALVIGELAVNSAKHGAVAHGGSVVIAGAVAAGRLEMVWRERSMGRVERRVRKGGQGLALIERIVRVRQGSIEFTWDAFGVEVRLGFALAA